MNSVGVRISPLQVLIAEFGRDMKDVFLGILTEGESEDDAENSSYGVVGRLPVPELATDEDREKYLRDVLNNYLLAARQSTALPVAAPIPAVTDEPWLLWFLRIFRFGLPGKARATHCRAAGCGARFFCNGEGGIRTPVTV